MLRGVLAEKEPDMRRGFRMRGRDHVSRIESFSDAVFGISLTLVVVSLQVPRTFDQLLATLAGLPAVAVGFVLLAQIWYLQYRFFRRYDLADRTTIVLNVALLFTIVTFTYPLKFLFANIVFLGTGEPPIRPEQVWQLFAIYGAGYAAVFCIFALLHRHALALRDELDLTPLECYETLISLRLCFMHIGVATASVAVAFGLTAAGWYGVAAFLGGMTYPIGFSIVATFLGRAHRRGRAAVERNASI